jgi:LysR family transcriptional regulator, low CO2-responsive transcriptional regulator
MNYAQLRAFHAVAAEGGFVKAAAKLNVTQPTLSEQVKQLEASYGVQLFERRGRQSVPTDLGRALLDVTRRFFAVEQEAEQLLSAARGLKRGRLRVAADAPYLVMPLLAAFGRRHPGIELQLTFGNGETVLAALKERRADLGVLPDVERERGLHLVALERGSLVLLVARTHPWARRRSVALAELASERLILREEGSTTRAILDRALAAAGIQPAAAWVVGSREGLREAVAEGLGIGAVFESEVGNDERVHAVSVRERSLATTEYLACLAERRSDRVIGAFLELVKG